MSYDDRDRGRRGLRRLYVGNVNRYVRERDLRDLFGKLGRLRDCELMSNFGFVEYEDPRDAEDAIREFDGYKLEGDRIQVEYARKGSFGSHRGRSSPSSSGERCYNCGEFGHIARECPIPKGRGDRAMRFEENRCFECGETGHLARDCVKRGGNPRQRSDARRSRSRSRSPVRSRSRSPIRSRGRSYSRSPRRDRASSRDRDRRRRDDSRDRRGDSRDRRGDSRDRRGDSRDRRGDSRDRRDDRY